MSSEIKVDTISEQTSANGIAIDGVTLKDSKIGIGTTSPTRQIQVEDTIANGGATIGLQTTDSSTSGTCGIIHFGNNTDSSIASINGLADGSTSAGALLFKTEADGGAIEERMRVSSAGRVGIATTDPTQALEINVDNTTAIATSGGIGSTNTDAANGLGIHNSNNSGVY